jgi:hypothetical protein
LAFCIPELAQILGIDDRKPGRHAACCFCFVLGFALAVTKNDEGFGRSVARREEAMIEAPPRRAATSVAPRREPPAAINLR